jgi:hypothetical protein
MFKVVEVRELNMSSYLPLKQQQQQLVYIYEIALHHSQLNSKNNNQWHTQIRRAIENSANKTVQSDNVCFFA